jgi:hypothetical protein
MCRAVIPLIDDETMFSYNKNDELKPSERKDGKFIMFVKDKKN